MESRLAAASTRFSYRVFSGAHNLKLCRVFSGKGRTADPSIYQGEVEAGPEVNRSNPEGIENSGVKAKLLKQEAEQSSKDENLKPTPGSAKHKSTGVNERLDPNMQQKRSNHNASSSGVEVELCP